MESSASKPKLLDRLRSAIRIWHYSRRTEEAYAGWVRRYVVFHGKRHPAEMGEPEIGRFLSYLAEDLKVSASTQNQALNALVFLYRQVLEQSVGAIHPFVSAKRPTMLPIVLTKTEFHALMEQLEGIPRLVAMLLYGSGLRLMECLTLRVKDLDFNRMEIRLRRAKGGKDRITMLPAAVKSDLLGQLRAAKAIHERDLAEGAVHAALPDAISRKYPNAETEWGWQLVFNSALARLAAERCVVGQARSNRAERILAQC